MAYVHGFKRGACGSAVDETMKSNEDFMAGFARGRSSALKTYAHAHKIYGTTSSPLRDT